MCRHVPRLRPAACEQGRRAQVSTNLSPTNQFSTILPLSGVLLLSLVKEASEDWRRHAADRAVNASPARVLRGGSLVDVLWRDIRVGDVVHLYDHDAVPADMVLLAAGETGAGLAYIETSSLDGENNLKLRVAAAPTTACRTALDISRVAGTVTCDAPNSRCAAASHARGRGARDGAAARRLYTFTGKIRVHEGRDTPLSNDNVLLRGTVLRNSHSAFGLVVYTGQETKLLKNANPTPSKRRCAEHRDVMGRRDGMGRRDVMGRRDGMGRRDIMWRRDVMGRRDVRGAS